LGADAVTIDVHRDVGAVIKPETLNYDGHIRPLAGGQMINPTSRVKLVALLITSRQVLKTELENTSIENKLVVTGEVVPTTRRRSFDRDLIIRTEVGRIDPSRDGHRRLTVGGSIDVQNACGRDTHPARARTGR